LFSIWPLFADELFASGFVAGQFARTLERQDERRLEQRLSPEHQYRDELLAGGGLQSFGMHRAVVRPDGYAFKAGLRRRSGEGGLRLPRLGGASFDGSIRLRGAGGQRGGHLADGRGVAVRASL